MPARRPERADLQQEEGPGEEDDGKQQQPGPVASRGDDRLSQTPLIEIVCVIEPRFQYRRRPAVIVVATAQSELSALSSYPQQFLSSYPHYPAA